MGRNKVLVSDTTFIIFGFDGPCGGYFANFFDMEDEDYKKTGHPTDEVGFFPGVSKNVVIEFLEKHKAIELVQEQVPEAWTNLCLDLPC